MNKLEIFIKNLCGEFNNDNQLKKEFESGKVVHPKARHINNVCNYKIKNLPENFEGYLLLKKVIMNKENSKMYFLIYFYLH